MPDRIRYRKEKKGFITPEKKWMKTELSALYKSTLRNSLESSNGLIKDSAFDHLNDMIEGKVKFSGFPWRVILFGRWINNNKIKTS